MNEESSNVKPVQKTSWTNALPLLLLFLLLIPQRPVQDIPEGEGLVREYFLLHAPGMMNIAALGVVGTGIFGLVVALLRMLLSTKRTEQVRRLLEAGFFAVLTALGVLLHRSL